MIVTSTEFQQNVGRYLKLAEEGEEIQINKLKPLKNSFKLVKVKAKTNKKPKNHIQEILKLAKKYQFHSGVKGENGLKLQRSVRS